MWIYTQLLKEAIKTKDGLNSIGQNWCLFIKELYVDFQFIIVSREIVIKKKILYGGHNIGSFFETQCLTETTHYTCHALCQ